MTRVLVIGPPRSGKTTYALARGVEDSIPVRHTDDTMSLDWSKASQVIAEKWLTQTGPWIIEGVAVVRALRKWLAAHPDGLPFDELVRLTQPRVELTNRQRGMAKACATIYAEIEPEVHRRAELRAWGNRILISILDERLAKAEATAKIILG